MNAVSFDSSDIDEVKTFLQSSDELYFQKMGFVAAQDNEHDELFEWYMRLKYSHDDLNIMLIMTYDCNCACKYCFEKLDNSLQITNSVNIVKITDFIKALYVKNRYKSIAITFFGGEPFLAYLQILEITETLNIIKTQIKFLVITNGTLLDYNQLKELARLGVKNYQITIDGPKEIHDIRRPCKNGISSWDVIISNLSYFEKLDIDLTIRINIDEQNVQYLGAILDSIPNTIKERKKTLFYISPIVGCLDCSILQTLNSRTKVVKQAWKDIQENGYPIKITPPAYAPCPYHSIESAFYLDLNGNVYTCGGFVGDIERIERKLSNKYPNYYERIKYTPPDTCFKCSFFPICMGGCQFEAKALGTHCQKSYLKAVYDEYFTKYAK